MRHFWKDFLLLSPLLRQAAIFERIQFHLDFSGCVYTNGEGLTLLLGPPLLG